MRHNIKESGLRPFKERVKEQELSFRKHIIKIIVLSLFMVFIYVLFLLSVFNKLDSKCGGIVKCLGAGFKSIEKEFKDGCQND